MVVSVAASGMTYLVLYWRELFRNARQVPGLVTGLSVRRLSQLAVWWLAVCRLMIQQTLMFTIMVLVLGIPLASSVATWKLAVSSLPIGAKVAIALCVIWGWVPFFLVYVFLAMPYVL